VTKHFALFKTKTNIACSLSYEEFILKKKNDSVKWAVWCDNQGEGARGGGDGVDVVEALYTHVWK
jgi:hypothetical protein